jgi:hypothetical protein
MSSWKNRLKNSDNDYYSPKNLILGMEKMVKIEQDFKKKALKASEEKTLMQTYKELLDHIILLAEKPFKEPQTDEEKRYFREPFVSYCTEMISYSKQRGPFWRRVRTREQKELLKMEDKYPKIFYHTLINSLKKMEFFKTLHFSDERDAFYKDLRISMELYSYIHICKYMNLRLQAIPEGIETVQEELKKLEAKVDDYQQVNFFLDKMLHFCHSLANEDIDEKTRTLIINERDMLRLVVSKLIQEKLKDSIDEDNARKDEFRAIVLDERKRLEKLKRKMGK